MAMASLTYQNSKKKSLFHAFAKTVREKKEKHLQI